MTEDADSEAEPGLDPREQRSAVQKRYGTIAVEGTSCCGDADVDETSSCCDADGADDDSPAAARALGYSEEDVESVVDGANLNLGCGNPTALADLRPGETVVDLGSGGGFDCLLAAREVGEDGRVIGVDMTPEMVERARENAERDDASNVEFRLGEIEHPPVADGTADVIISNCVLNLSPEKPQVLREAHRVRAGRTGLRGAGGRRPRGADRRPPGRPPDGARLRGRLRRRRRLDPGTGVDAGRRRLQEGRDRTEGRKRDVHPGVGRGTGPQRLRRLGDDRGREAGTMTGPRGVRRR